MRPSLQDRLRRTLGATRGSQRMLKSALLIAAFLGAIFFAATYDRQPDLSHVRVAFLSGSPEGNYHAVIARVAEQARRQRGRIDNIASAGSIENIERLAAAKSSCKVQFALVQDGLSFPDSHAFQLIGRLPIDEALLILGRDADGIKSLADLHGKRIGIGPAGSGSEHVARQVIAQLGDLGIQVSNQTLQEQIGMLQRGDLDLGMMVIDVDAQLVVDAVRQGGLQIMDIAAAEALAHRLPSARTGVIKAGYYDPVRNLPPTDKRVVQVDTLVIGNGCARESVTQGVITAFTRVFPDFVRINRESANLTGLDYASAARSYYDAQGPDRVGERVPWFIDIMPTAQWLQLVFAFSVLFGAQALWHRFRLWRLDARRVALENEVGKLFAPGITVAEIEALEPEARQRSPETRARIDALLRDLGVLARRARRQSLSMFVPMGQEMSYRYQEGLVADLVYALRRFRDRLGD
jgi:TRAP-type uncharacterized transport system substrate-binding protein